jgi:hypothetical protein
MSSTPSVLNPEHNLLPTRIFIMKHVKYTISYLYVQPSSWIWTLRFETSRIHHKLRCLFRKVVICAFILYNYYATLPASEWSLPGAENEMQSYSVFRNDNPWRVYFAVILSFVELTWIFCSLESNAACLRIQPLERQCVVQCSFFCTTRATKFSVCSHVCATTFILCRSTRRSQFNAHKLQVVKTAIPSGVRIC